MFDKGNTYDAQARAWDTYTDDVMNLGKFSRNQ